MGSSPIWDDIGFNFAFVDRGRQNRTIGILGARSVMVIIGASQALDPGSIPGERKPGH